MRNPVKNDYITAKRLDKATTWAIALSSTFIIISCLQLKFEHLNIQRISEIVAFVFGAISWILSLVCSKYILNADSNRKKMRTFPKLLYKRQHKKWFATICSKLLRMLLLHI